MTKRHPVILLNINVEDMYGTNSSTASKFFFKPTPDFIINGMLRKHIREIIGNKFVVTPMSMAP